MRCLYVAIACILKNLLHCFPFKSNEREILKSWQEKAFLSNFARSCYLNLLQLMNFANDICQNQQQPDRNEKPFIYLCLKPIILKKFMPTVSKTKKSEWLLSPCMCRIRDRHSSTTLMLYVWCTLNGNDASNNITIFCFFPVHLLPAF